ncbi:metal-dependent transcriptional regulator [Pontiellaceae bacterium B1224]|nr:metal-dependent transcriptional regulator [Pontiellaceae bacterium B1224]
MNSRTTENYLKAVYRHSRANSSGNVSLGIIAGDLGVTPGTVTQMMKHLSGRDLVVYESRRGAALTDSGERAALDIIRRHRLIELFLVEVMGLDWADVHDEAEELEHVVSDRLIARMDEMLGHPARDPHGAPIPSASGVLKSGQTRRLAECETGTYRLIQVTKETSGFLEWLSEYKFFPGSIFDLHHIDSMGGTLSLGLSGQNKKIVMSIEAAGSLLVEEAG